jgi:transposase
MFIKEIKKSNKNPDKIFIYHRLVEPYRTEKGPRHRNILNLGTLTIQRSDWKLLADRIEQIVNGNESMFAVPAEIEALARHYAAILIEKKIMLFGKETVNYEKKDKTEYKEIALSSIKTSKCRSIGAEYIAYSMMKKLGFIDIFKSLGFSDEEINHAALSITGRLVFPASEKATHAWARNTTALDELLGCDFSHLSKNSLYEIIDKLYANRQTIESSLRANEKTIFTLKEKIILYDLTNTYFEGDARSNPKARHGRSKDKRNDRPLVTLGLVVDEMGFPKRSKVMEGNVSEPKTMLSMIEDLSSEGEETKPTVLIDAGIATEENLNMLRQLGYDYVCVARNRPVKPEEIGLNEMLIVKEDKKNRVEVKIFKGETESVLYCQSFLKGKKEEAMKNMYETRFESGMKQIAAAIHKKRGTKAYGKVMERIGRLKSKLSPIARFYEIAVEKDENEIVTKIEWQKVKQEQKEFFYSGKYFLRSSRTDLEEKELWDLYIVLTNIESSFRAMKYDLNMRPIHHQKEERSAGHIFITVLAYHILNAVLTKLGKSGEHYNWTRLRHVMSTQVRVTTSMKSRNGEQFYLRNTSQAEKEQEIILRNLNLKIDPLGAKLLKL